MSVVQITDEIAVGGGQPLLLISGPCVIETASVMTDAVSRLAALARDNGVPLLFKSSYEKDNRASGDAFRGPGLQRGLECLAALKQQFGIALLTDVHRVSDVKAAADVVDVVQVPAFLCRQTSLLEAVGGCQRAVNVKKGQFMGPAGMAAAVAKVRAAGGHRVLLTERGSSFGYDRLVCDLCAIPQMKRLGCPVVFDAGHASNEPGEIATLACAGVAAGADAVFIESHPDPANAQSDDKRMLSISQLEQLLPRLVELFKCVRECD